MVNPAVMISPAQRYRTGHRPLTRPSPDGTLNEYTVAVPNTSTVGITAGPDGALWFTGYSYGNVPPFSLIGRITTGGAITQFLLPNAAAAPSQIATGPDGALWFTETQGHAIGRITTSGSITEFPLSSTDFPYGITAGPDGALWFTTRGSIGRITTSGTITKYPVPADSKIVAGPDGALWFMGGVPTGFNTTVSTLSAGRITTQGVVSLYPLNSLYPAPPPYGVTVGPDGALWYTASDWTNFIARVTTDGVVADQFFANDPSAPKGVNPVFGIATGSDGAIWFAESQAIARFPTLFTLNSTSASVGANGGTGTVSITASLADAHWTAATNAPWIAITSGAGTGRGNAAYTVAANTGATRTGAITIAGQSFTVTQAGAVCSFSIPNPTASLPSGAGTFAPLTGSFTLAASATCTAANTWAAVSDSPYLTVTSGASGNGATASSTVSFSMFTNSTTKARTAHIAVAGQTFTVTQDGTTESQSQRIVRALYQTILGREPDSAGWAFWTGPGAPVNASGAVLYNQMADGFYTSSEFRSTGWAVLAIYQTVLNRLPTYSEWASAVAGIRQGTLSPAQLTDNLAGNVSASLFVQQVIQNGWRRAATTNEIAIYSAMLNGESRYDFLNTVIFPNADFLSGSNPSFVAMLYYTIFVRPYDQGGFDFWLAEATNSPGMAGIYPIYLTPASAYAMKLAIIGQASPVNPALLGFLGSPEFQGLIQ